jgi:predicted TIM-barrel fold metal-dependent hydrolase
MIRTFRLIMVTSPAPPQTLVDHHQHLFHPVDTGLAAALVLSVAYQFANPNRPAVEGEYAKVRAENDWTSEQVARFPERLRGFCAFNPLRDYALLELARCAQDAQIALRQLRCRAGQPQPR